MCAAFRVYVLCPPLISLSPPLAPSVWTKLQAGCDAHGHQLLEQQLAGIRHEHLQQQQQWYDSMTATAAAVTAVWCLSGTGLAVGEEVVNGGVCSWTVDEQVSESVLPPSFSPSLLSSPLSHTLSLVTLPPPINPHPIHSPPSTPLPHTLLPHRPPHNPPASPAPPGCRCHISGCCTAAS